MATPLIQPAFSSGELAPSMFGRVDISKYHTACSTMRNFYAAYRGGASTRAGLKFVGRSKTPGTSTPPRIIRFQFSLTQGYILEFGDLYMRVIYQGAYVTDTVTGILNLQLNDPVEVTVDAASIINNGDWVTVSGTGTALDTQSFIAQGVAIFGVRTFFLFDPDGNPVDGTTVGTWNGGGTISRVYETASPYPIRFLPALKFVQSADVMTITHPDFNPYDLTRVAADNWVFSVNDFGSVISPPATVNAAATVTTTTNTTQYAYAVTAVNSDGQESIASVRSVVSNSVDISITAGSIALNWATVEGARTYNVYKAPAAYNTDVPVGSLFAYAGTTYGTSFVDTNITADAAQVPPLHKNPFAEQAIIGITNIVAGAGGDNTTTVTASSASGHGAVLTPVIQGGALVAIIVEDGGKGYNTADTVLVFGGAGAGFGGTIVTGPATGTFPSVCGYFQERRVYGNTNNQPDTYFMSQPGAFQNFDSRIPTIDSDAITGTPWSLQVNGIQAFVTMPGGLVVLTGSGAWQVQGAGSSGAIGQQPITPANQQAIPQAYNGCHDHVPPLTINYDILYVQSKGSIVRDLAYNFYVNIYTGTDLTILSSHLFSDHQILEWAWAEEPYKLIWAVRNDGVLLCDTYLKEQEINAWTRHDTQGLFCSVATVTEIPVDAPYFVVKRKIRDSWQYFVERMDNRIWADVEDCWCVDAALQLPQPAPDATLEAASAEGFAGIGSYLVTDGGEGYTAPVGTLEDPTGTGATFTITVSGGVITAVTKVTDGSGYTDPQFSIYDSTGTGAAVQPVIENDVVFTANQAIFGSQDVGKVIRMGGGKATITAALDGQHVTADITQPITMTIPNDPDNTPLPATSGNWTMTMPITTVEGLNYLEGMTVTGLADGQVIEPQVVAGGSITLPEAASAIIVGLPFLPQLQTLYLDAPGGGPTLQGRRKNIQQVTMRFSESRGVECGTNQIDASTQPDNPIAVAWSDDGPGAMVQLKERSNQISAGSAVPLMTGDFIINVPSEWRKPGQVAVQCPFPLPCTLLAVIPEATMGDDAGAP